MKVIVSPNGDVIFETDDVEQALSMVQALRNGTAQARRKKPKPEPPVEEYVEEEVPLSLVLAETWEWLVSHDDPVGIPFQEVATSLGLKHATATWRLNKLVEKGVAHKVKRGFYRAGEA